MDRLKEVEKASYLTVTNHSLWSVQDLTASIVRVENPGQNLVLFAAKEALVCLLVKRVFVV